MAKEPRMFTVEGTGIFPFDMLRYDACWPVSESKDSPALALGLMNEACDTPRRVVLATNREHGPTHGRWESFTWRVVGLGDRRDG